MIGRLFQVFWSITVLRAGPQVLPASPVLLWLVLPLHWLVGVALGLFSAPLGVSALSSLLGTLIMVAVVQGLLSLRGLGTRAMQTVTALAGGEALLGLMMLQVSLAYFTSGGELGAAALLSLFLLGWNVALATHILRQALEVPTAVAFLGALGYIFVSLAAAGAFDPQGA